MVQYIKHNVSYIIFYILLILISFASFKLKTDFLTKNRISYTNNKSYINRADFYTKYIYLKKDHKITK